MNAPIGEGCALICRALDARADEWLMTRWIVGGYERVMSFDQFRDKLQGAQKVDTRTPDDIFGDVADILGGVT